MAQGLVKFQMTYPKSTVSKEQSNLQMAGGIWPRLHELTLPNLCLIMAIVSAGLHTFGLISGIWPLFMLGLALYTRLTSIFYAMRDVADEIYEEDPGGI